MFDSSLLTSLNICLVGSPLSDVAMARTGGDPLRLLLQDSTRCLSRY